MEAANKEPRNGGNQCWPEYSLPHEQESNRYLNVSLDFIIFNARKVMFREICVRISSAPRRIRDIG